MAEMVIIGPLLPYAEKLLLAILGVKEKYKPELELLKSTLESVLPRIRERRQLDGELDRPSDDLNKLIELVRKGEKLVKTCDEIPFWNYILKYFYLKKIVNLEQSLRDYFRINVTMDTSLDVKQLRIDVNELLRRSEEKFLSGDLCSAPKILDRAVGLEGPLVKLKRELFREDVTVFGLCAPGGYGKTTLAAKLCHDKEVRDRFEENVLYIPEVRSSKLEAIVERLLRLLASRSQLPPKILNEKDAFNLLEKRLKEREPEPVLLVLDDVWEESVVQKFDFRIEGYKLLVTSREAFKTFKSIYSLTTLSEKNAMALFKNIAFPQGGDEYEKPDEDTLDKIVKGCKRVPLVLDVIAWSLRSQPPQKWRSTANKLSSSIFNSYKDLLNRLASSLDSLDDDTVRNCFIDLGSFREDQRIPASALIDMWVELYDELDEDDAYLILFKLSTKNLINLVEISRDAELDGNINKLFVVQHDLLRDLAIYQSEQKQLSTRLIIHKGEDGQSKGWRELNHKCRSAHLVSIHSDLVRRKDEMSTESPATAPDSSPSNFSSSRSTNLISSSSPLQSLISNITSLITVKVGVVWRSQFLTAIRAHRLLQFLTNAEGEMLSSSWCDMEFPVVGVLILNLSTTEYTLPPFMKKMEKLKVLIIVNHGYQYRTKLSDLTTLGYLSHLKRIRLEKVWIPSLDEITLPLENLQKISLVNCEIGQAFHNCTVEIPKILPNLIEIDVDYCHDLVELPPGICAIIPGLQKLSITNCHKLCALPEAIGRMTNLEVLKLHACTGLLELPGSIQRLQKLRLLDISDCLSINKLPEGMGKLRGLKKLDMRQCLGVKELPRSTSDLGQLEKVICDEETVHLWEPFRSNLSKLNIEVRAEEKTLNWLDIDLHNLHF